MALYSLLLGAAVALSVMFFWVGRRANRTNLGLDTQIQQYLQDNPTSMLQAADFTTPPTPGFMERVFIPNIKSGLKLLGGLTPARNVESIAKKLDTAGRPYGLTLINFLGLQLIMAVVFAPLGFLLFNILLKQSVTVGVIFLVLFGIIGSFLPNIWLSAYIRSRKHLILRALPNALDMIVVCTEAGLSFDQSMRRVSEFWRGPLSEEFNRILAEIAIGRTRRQALAAASDRIAIPEMSNLIAAILQARSTIEAEAAEVLRELVAQIPDPTGTFYRFSMASSMRSASSATAVVITPSARTWAKSRTRRSSRLATRGVPRLRLAISTAPAGSQLTPRISALRVMMIASSSSL